jgi:mRNA-degrading endonuclease RelE of RelBE toxin-antitoxin system
MLGHSDSHSAPIGTTSIRLVIVLTWRVWLTPALGVRSQQRKSPMTWLSDDPLASDTCAPVHDHLHPGSATAARQSAAAGRDRAVRALTGPVAANSRRLGKPLDAPFEEVLSTRRADYRALYTVDEQVRVITVLAVAHRRDAYRPRRSSRTPWTAAAVTHTSTSAGSATAIPAASLAAST